MDKRGSSMRNFGKIPPRSLESFGVAGVLDENCKVFYDSLFSPKHIGRVSDLLSAQLKDVGLDELKLRALVLFSFFEAFRGFRGPESEADRLNEPLTVECGLDEEKMALGIQFKLSESLSIELEGIEERVSKREPASAFEGLLCNLHEHADHLCLRAKISEKKLEIVSLLRIKILESESPDVSKFTAIDLDSAEPAESPKASTYVALGDLDYAKLLKAEGPAQVELPEIRTGELLARDAETGKWKDLRVSGEKELGPEFKTIAGVTQHIDNPVTMVHGNAPSQDEELVKVSGGMEPNAPFSIELAPSAVTTEQVKLYVNKIAELQQRIHELEFSQGLQAEAEEEEGTNRLTGFFKKVWPFKANSLSESEGDEGDEESQGEEVGEEEEELETGTNEPISTEEAVPEAKEKTEPTPAEAELQKEEHPEEEKPADSTANAEVAANSLVAEFQGGAFERTLAKAKSDLSQMKNKIKDEKVKAWVDNFMQELVHEKARLQDIAKKLSIGIRQKELQIRNKEQNFNEELKIRDKAIRQKNDALARAKEQISHMADNIDKLKASNQTSSEDTHYKQKLTFTQKMLTLAKEDNARLKDRCDDLKTQLASTQLAQKSTTGVASSELSQLRARLDRTHKQMDEFKRANQDLIQTNEELKASLRESQGKSGGFDGDGHKKRLEGSIKLNAAYQKEIALLKSKLEDVQKGKGRGSKSSHSKGSGGGSGPPAAA